MINLYLVRKCGLTADKMVNFVNQKKVESPAIFLFPEYTFRKKLIYNELENVLNRLTLDEETSVFFSAFVLEQKTVDEKMAEYKEEWWTEGTEDDELSRLLLAPHYINKGILVNGSDDGNIIRDYAKYTLSEFDSINCPSVNGDIIKMREEDVGVYEVMFSGNKDYSQEKIPFPVISLEEKDIEFRVCSDIKCGTQNNPDVIMVSASGLRNVPERTRDSLDGQLLIINDPGRPFDPRVHKGKWSCRTPLGFRKVQKEEGIRIKYIFP